MSTQNRMTVVAMLAVVGLALGCAAPPPADSPEVRLELAQQIAQLESAGGALEQTLNLGTALALEPSLVSLGEDLGRETTAEDEAAVEKLLRAALAEVLTAERFEAAVAAVYAEHFTTVELTAILEFYETPAGARVLELQDTLTTEIGDATEAILDENLEAFIGHIDERLLALYPEFSEEGP